MFTSMDTIYKPQDVDIKLRPIFEQLVAEFPAPYQVWRRVEDFDRRETAAVMDPSTKRAATVTIRNGNLARPDLLNAAEIQKIHKHFKSHATKDLILSSTLI
jgi:hypothetical protein